MPLPDFDRPRNNALLKVEGNGGNIAVLVEELGRFAADSQYIIGVTVESNASEDGTAFAGGHTTAYREDYGTMTVRLDTPDGIRDATQLFISDERIAEITDAYTLPDHLKKPTNHVDAFISHVIKGLVGYSENTDESIAEQAEATTDTITTIPTLTQNQVTAARMFGEANLSRAQQNELYRSIQVETMEHVLRFLITKEQAKAYTKGNFNGGIDYEWGTGILGEALAIVNGVNGFNEDHDPSSNDLLYRGALQQKSSVAAKDGVIYNSGINGPEPIWPPEAVEEYKVKQLALARAENEQRARMNLQAELAETQRTEAIAQQKEELHRTMDILAQDGYSWAGIMQIRPDTPLDSVEKVRSYFSERHEVAIEDVQVLKDTAVYGGSDPHRALGDVTIYVRNLS